MRYHIARGVYKKVSILSIAFVFALTSVSGSLIPLLLAKTVSAAGQPQIVSVDAYYVKSSYKGVGTDIKVDGLTDVTNVEVRLNRADNSTITKTSKTPVNTTLSTGNVAAVTAPIVIQHGTYNETGSSSWNPGTPWTGASAPVSVTVNITYNNGATLTATDSTISETLAQQSEVVPVDKSTVYVATTGNDSNTGTSLVSPFATIQKGLDEVDTNGTVFVADGTYTGTARIKKNGTKLVGISNSRDKVTIKPSQSSGQGGLYASGINNITIKNLGVFGDNFGTNGGLIKLDNGSNARIDNVAVKNSQATGININSYSNVVVTGAYIVGTAKDGISVIAQQNTTTNVSKDITIQNSSISQKTTGWSAIAFYTATGNSKSIENVQISNVSTQYGARGIYVSGAGGTVTSPGSNKLLLNNVTFGQNTNEYINNEQSADIDARTSKINVGGGVVVPAANMTQTQYNALITKIKDRTHKSNPADNYGFVRLIDLAAPNLTLATSSGTDLVSGGASKEKDVIASWNQPIGEVSGYTYKIWTNISGNPYTVASPYAANLTALSRSGELNQGNGKYFIQVFATDPAGNTSAGSNIFEISYDTTKPIATLLAPTTAFVTDPAANLAVQATDVTGLNKVVANIYKAGQSSVYKSTQSSANGATDFTHTANIGNLPNGEYSIRYNTTDTAGNLSATKSFSFTVDTSAPTVPVITNPANGQFFATNNILNKWSASTDNLGVAGYQIAYRYADGHTFGSSTCPGEVISGLAVSGCRDTTSTSRTHSPSINEQMGVTIWVRAIDIAGNKSDWSTPISYTYDATNPVVDVTEPVISPVGGNVAIRGTVTDQNPHMSTVTIMKDGAPIAGETLSSGLTSHTYNWDTIGLADGEYTVTFTATDAAGNLATPVSKVIVIDNTKPVINTPVSFSRNTDGTVTLSGSINDNSTISNVNITLDGDDLGSATLSGLPGTTNWTIATLDALNNRLYTGEITATDAAGNSETKTFSIDLRIPPIVTNARGNTNTTATQILAANTVIPTQGINLFNNNNPTGQTGFVAGINTGQPISEEGQVKAASTTSDKKEKEIVETASSSLAWYWILLAIAVMVATYYAYRNWKLGNEK